VREEAEEGTSIPIAGTADAKDLRQEHAWGWCDRATNEKGKRPWRLGQRSTLQTGRQT
jgi:hypothetical protein